MAILSGNVKEMINYRLDAASKNRLIEIVQLAPPSDAVFLAAIEKTIQKALTITDVKEIVKDIKVKGTAERAEIKRSLEKLAKVSTTLLEGLAQLPGCAYQLFHGGRGYSTLKSMAEEMEREIHNAHHEARVTLSGKGADRNLVPYLLAADIAQAFEIAGLKFSIHQDKTLSGKVVRHCLNIIGEYSTDIRDYLREGLTMHKRRSRQINRGMIALK